MCAGSLLAREGLPVSVPIWPQELAELKGANQWTLANIDERLAEGNDPWQDYAGTRQSISATMRKRLGVR